ncbi:hypothetical protein Ancab_017523 [Ancistrocladus abbreviatus]
MSLTKQLEEVSVYIIYWQSSQMSTGKGNVAESASCPLRFQGKRLDMRLPNVIGGKFVDSQSLDYIDVLNPATQQVVSQVPFTTDDEFKAAVFLAKHAFSSWRSTPIATRQQNVFIGITWCLVFFPDKLGMSISTEQGKMRKKAYAHVYHGLEMVEHVCGTTTLQMGEFVSNISSGVDTYKIREPLGVCAGICLSSFSAISPFRMFPIAIACGNTFILKPSEKNPGSISFEQHEYKLLKFCFSREGSVILAELLVEAGLPSGVLNIVHGIDSYVDGKSYAIVMPDANIDATVNSLITAAFGAAGQRCITLSTVIFVGESKSWESKLVEHAKTLKINAGTEADADLGPVISIEEKERLCRLIENNC